MNDFVNNYIAYYYKLVHFFRKKWTNQKNSSVEWTNFIYYI